MLIQQMLIFLVKWWKFGHVELLCYLKSKHYKRVKLRQNEVAFMPNNNTRSVPLLGLLRRQKAGILEDKCCMCAIETAIVEFTLCNHVLFC
jgi:hypothetical protein